MPRVSQHHPGRRQALRAMHFGCGLINGVGDKGLQAKSIRLLHATGDVPITAKARSFLTSSLCLRTPAF
jgi:hypothetical protein